MDPVVLRILLVVGLLVATVAFGRWWQHRDGRVRAAGDDVRLHPDDLAAVGLDLTGARAGAVLLGSPTCTPCTSVKRLLGEVTAERDGFRWVYADAADHLELAETHRVLRVPTLFVVDGEGRVLARTSGVPAKDDLLATVDGSVAA
ncbi:thioredoxin family protein [Nitriliruptoraceae bacterium ZYF776]|nr:thioredoxin family protein [Profundirhabdus halotolerans]